MSPDPSGGLHATQQRCRLLIAEDHTMFREGLRALLAKETGFEVVAETDNGRDALRGVATHRPDVVLMDLSLPHLNGTEAISHIKRRWPETLLVVLTAHKDEEHVRAALEAGATGYVVKDESHATLLVALESVRKGQVYLSPSVSAQVVAGYLGGHEEAAAGGGNPSWRGLTQREREVLKLVAEGHRNREIAEQLSLSPKTVEKHRAGLMKKLGLSNTSELTAYAIRNGLVS